MNEFKDISTKKKHWVNKIPVSFHVLLTGLALAWGLEIVDWILPGEPLDQYGIRPRSVGGLIGIPLMPFLHGGFGHLLSNTFPFLILGWIVVQAEGKNFITATWVIIILCGLGTWLIGRADSVHIGASGLVYGYFGYVIVRAFMERNLVWIITGLIVAVFFGSMIFGVIPSFRNAISWEGHLCGMLAGAWFGWRKSKGMKDLMHIDDFKKNDII